MRQRMKCNNQLLARPDSPSLQELLQKGHPQMIRINKLRKKRTAVNSVLRDPMKKRANQMLKVAKMAMMVMPKAALEMMMEKRLRVTNPPPERRRGLRLMSHV